MRIGCAEYSLFINETIYLIYNINILYYCFEHFLFWDRFRKEHIYTGMPTFKFCNQVARKKRAIVVLKAASREVSSVANTKAFFIFGGNDRWLLLTRIVICKSETCVIPIATIKEVLFEDL